MTDKDVEFFQGIAQQIMLYCAKSRIDNKEVNKIIDFNRAKIKLYKKDPAEAVPVDKQLNENLLFWTAKEVKELPFLKNLKYRKIPGGLHQFRYRRKGYDVAFTSKSFNKAKEKARKFIADLKEKDSKLGRAKRINALCNIAEKWFEERAYHVDASTQRSYLSVYRNHVEPAFGHKDVGRILPMDLQPFFNALHGTKGKTCESAKVILNGIFKFAMANRLCPSNPMDGVIIERHERKPGRALTVEEIAQFKNVMAGWKDFGCAYLIILYSGIRGAELEKMTFDWEQGTFTVFNAKLKKSQKRNVANLTRTVPIFAGLKVLKSRIETESWRIPARKLSNHLSERWTGTTVKDLRHTFTSLAREARIENELVNLWTGHLPGNNVTANIYTHYSMTFQKTEAEKLGIY